MLFNWELGIRLPPSNSVSKNWAQPHPNNFRLNGVGSKSRKICLKIFREFPTNSKSYSSLDFEEDKTFQDQYTDSIL